MVLNHNQSFISFGYVALSYLSPVQINYVYIMEGFDKDWHFVGNNRTATYTNLYPGKYVFRVKACNNDGYWNQQGASISIVVKPAVCQTVWAYMICLLGISLIIYGVIRFFRFKDKIKQQMEIQRIEADKQHWITI
jgi:hypothetical protein